jgi:hypothetical protein
MTQSIWRKVQNTGLTKRYRTDYIFRKRIKMLAALSFLKPEEVILGFEDILET